MSNKTDKCEICKTEGKDTEGAVLLSPASNQIVPADGPQTMTVCPMHHLSVAVYGGLVTRHFTAGEMLHQVALEVLRYEDEGTQELAAVLEMVSKERS